MHGVPQACGMEHAKSLSLTGQVLLATSNHCNTSNTGTMPYLGLKG